MKDKKITMLTCYSESHEKLYYEYFKYTFDMFLKDEFVLLPYRTNNKGGCYKTDEWKKMIKFKLTNCYEYLINSLDGELIVVSDCDIIFLDKVKDVLLKEMLDYDMVFQSDHGELNTGFFIVKNSNRIKKMFKLVIDDDESFKINEDQGAINNFLFNNNIYNIRFGRLSNSFFSPWMSSIFLNKNDIKYKICEKDRNRFINIGDDNRLIVVPDYPIFMAHANYIGGVDQKCIFLDRLIENKNIKKGIL